LNKEGLYISDSKIIFAISLIISMMGIFGFLSTATTTVFAQTSTTSTKNTNATLATNSSTFSSPVNSFASPEGYAIAKKHVYDAPSLDVHNYCSASSGRILASCLLFDGNTKNATLIGIEYVISAKDYASLADRDKPNWTPVSMEEGKDVDLRFPYLTPQQLQGLSKQFEGAYAKLIITWNPNDKLPQYPPQIVIESLLHGTGNNITDAQEHKGATITSSKQASKN
jgi:hypothetical protein